MALPLFAAPAGTLAFRVANLAAFLEDLLHEIVSGEGPARAAPIFGASRPSVIGKQGTDLSLQCGHSFFKRRSGHDWTPTSKVKWYRGHSRGQAFNPPHARWNRQ